MSFRCARNERSYPLWTYGQDYAMNCEASSFPYVNSGQRSSFLAQRNEIGLKLELAYYNPVSFVRSTLPDETDIFYNITLLTVTQKVLTNIVKSNMSLIIIPEQKREALLKMLVDSILNRETFSLIRSLACLQPFAIVCWYPFIAGVLTETLTQIGPSSQWRNSWRVELQTGFKKSPKPQFWHYLGSRSFRHRARG